MLALVSSDCLFKTFLQTFIGHDKLFVLGKEKKLINIVIAAFLDFLLGDPYNFPHPVRFMGSIISREEKFIRKFFHSEYSLQISGICISVINISIGYILPFLLLYYTSGVLRNILSIYIIYTSISGKMLAYEANEIKKSLEVGVEPARERLKYIVGRDTDALNEEEIIAATVETVAENTSDGVIAPLFYIVLFGPAGGWMYKFVNTMDSMLGYKNDKYKDLGKASALIDDFFNYLPARITGFLMILSSFSRYPWKKALGILFRDHKNHSSPNAGYPESAVSGLLGIQLGGGHYYFGKFVDKPTIGDKDRKLEVTDIQRVVEILYRTTIVAILLSIIIYNKLHI